MDHNPVNSMDEAVAMLAQHALSSLWQDSDFQPGGTGCCHVCCAPCAALEFFDSISWLDEILSPWPEGIRNSSMFVDGKVDREWLHRQWSGSEVQKACGHRWQT